MDARITIDTLAVHWWEALDAAQSALDAAGRALPPGEATRRWERLARERGETAEALRALAHDLHARSVLLDWLAAPERARRMLGLPRLVSACVFDLDGVLTHSPSVHAAAWADTFEPLLVERAARGGPAYVPFDPQRDYEQSLAGRSRLEGVHAFLASRAILLPEGASGDPPGAETVYGLAGRKRALLEARLARSGVPAFEGSLCYLEAARSVGVRRAVVSASEHTEAILESAGLAHLVEQRVDGNTIEAEHLRVEPAPDTLLAASERLHVDPARIAAFETTPAGVVAARAAGVGLVVGVERDRRAGELRASGADLVVRDLADLLAA